MTIYNAISFCGLFILLFIAWIFSAHRHQMNWRVIGIGLIIQLDLGCLLFTIPAGAKVFSAVNNSVITILNSAAEGAKFVFGPLALAPGQTDTDGNASPGFVLAFQAFPTIIFFSALIAILYHIGIMSLVLRGFAYVFTKFMRISGAESLVASSNIFVGIESTLTIKPYLIKGTWSLKGMCGFIFYPLTLLLGVPMSEAMTVSRIIGERLVVTEVVAYQDLADVMAQEQLSMRSAVITTYALCGFAHVASMSIFVGGICALAPDKTRQISQVAVRALFAATLACLMTACIAGIFYSDQSILFGGN